MTRRTARTHRLRMIHGTRAGDGRRGRYLVLVGSDTLLQRIEVRFAFSVCFTRQAFVPENDALVSALGRLEREQRQRVLVLVDRGLARARPDLGRDVERYAEHHRARLELCRAPLIVAGGEEAKNDPRHLQAAQRAIEQARIDRHAFVMAIGGGAMLDMVGFAAATAHRGVRLVRVPTTVLSQADSAVGVKNGINAFGKKNFLGTFTPPFAVVIDSGMLTTLPRRDTVAGMAEAIKVALIRDARLFEWIAARQAELAACDPEAVAQLVRRCAEQHLAHIAGSGDPFELGSARPLDFGHWAAHKLESLSHHRLRHGEAVAIGMAIDTLYAAALGHCDTRLAERTLGLLRGLGFRLWDETLGLRDGLGRPRLLEGLEEFREHLGGELCVTLPAGLGMGLETRTMDEGTLRATLDRLQLEDAA
jgi:3-dehydroquinate synthase